MPEYIKRNQLTVDTIQKLSFEEILRLIEGNQIAEPYLVTLDLSDGLDNKRIEIAGNFFAMLDATDSNVSIKVQFNTNSTTAPQFPFTKGLQIKKPFRRIFISAESQPGKTVTLVISNFGGVLFDINDNRSAQTMTATLEEIRDELKGGSTASAGGGAIALAAEGVILSANPNRKSFGIYNPIGNDYLYIRFDNTVVDTTNYAICLPSGACYIGDDYQGIIRGLMATSGQYAHYWEI